MTVLCSLFVLESCCSTYNTLHIIEQIMHKSARVIMYKLYDQYKGRVVATVNSILSIIVRCNVQN